MALKVRLDSTRIRCSWCDNAPAKDCGTYTDTGAALVDGNGEVVRHAHRELGHAGVTVLLFVTERRRSV